MSGFVLNIDDKLLKNLEKADELVQDIGKHSEQTRDMFNNAFQSMATGSLDGFISKLMSARQAIQDIGDAKVSDKGFGSISTQAVQGADSVNNLVESITRLMQVAQGREKVQPIDINSIDIAEDNIESLREKIATLKRLLSQNRQGLIDETQQQNAKLLLDEINRLQVAYGNLRTEQKNLQSFDKVFSLSEDTISQTEKKLAKMRELWSNLYKDPQKYEEELKKVTAEIQRLIKRKSDLKKLTTFEGAMDFSKSTKSIKDQIQAIKYLKAARENLSKEGMSEADYRKKVKELTDEIKRQQKEVDKLVGKNSDLGKSHKSLINTADQLKRAFALVFSVSAIRGYVTQIARVRGEFELQQRSLQAILQNKDEADRLWQQTVQLAVRSPFQVKELVTYTKQLAAYRVESDKLYDTTKMLADVSAGLGVDMNRLILAYGQVKAANYLRGTELRQFSEAGVNILEELAKYFEEVEGRAVSVGDVFERVSKRMVTFADVEEIFKRITSEGGVFYNMQEIQAETLKGQISNLRDAIDIMLNEIGQKNEHILKSVVGVVRTVVQNWEVLVPILKAVVAGFALTRVNALLAKESIMLMAIDLGVLVNAEQKALTVTQLLNVGFRKLWKSLKAAGAAAKAFVASNPLFVALVAIAAVLLKVGRAIADHKQEIKEINDKYEELANTVRGISNKMVISQKNNNLEQMKGQLLSLIELAEREYNMEINVDVSKLDSTQIANKFVEIREKIFNAQEFAKTMKLAIQNQKTWYTPESLELTGDLERAENATVNLYNTLRRNLTNIVYELNQGAIQLNETQQEALNKLSSPRTETQTQYQYVNQLLEGYKGINDVLDKISPNANEIRESMRLWGAALGQVSNEMTKLFHDLEGEVQLMSELDKPYYIKTAIDKQGWTDMQREIAYFFANEHFGINITPALPVPDKNDSEGGKLREEQFKRQLALIKKLRSEYLKLTKEMGKEDALKLIKEHYKDAFDQIFQGTGVDWDFIFDASEKGYVTALGELRPLAEKAGKAAKDAFEKELSGSAINVEIKTKSDAKKQLKQQVDSLFAQFDLSRELEKLGLSKGLMKSLFDVEYLDLDSLKSQVIEKFAGTTTELQTELKKDVSTIDWAKIEELIGKERAKEAKQSIEKITDMEAKAAKERVKTYVKYLMEAQREAVKIKVEELRKLKEIEESKEFSPEQKQEIKDRVRKETNAELQKQEWTDFQNSEMYTMMFEDLEHYGTQALETLREKLIQLKSSLTDLPASEVKEIINQLSKIEDITIERNPFRALKETRKQIKAEGVSEKQAQTNLAQSENEIAKLQSELDIINIVNTAKSKGLAIDKETQYAYDDIVVEMADMGVAEADIVKHKENSLKAENENAQAAKKTLDIYERQGKARIATLNRTKDILGSVQDAIKASMELMDSFGVSTDSIGYTLAESTDSMISLTISAIEFTIQLKAMGIAANSALGIIGYIAIGIQAVATAISAIFKMHDAGLQKQIDDLAVQTEDLQEKFETLEAAVDKAYSTDTLKQASKDAEKYTKQMIANYKAMIELEKQKKKTDEEKIKEYEESIAAQQEALEDLKQDMLESMGGVTDYRSATQDFVDAWVEAYKECGDGLNGLQDNFTEFFDNLIKQQATMKVTEKFLEPFYNNLNAYLDDYELTKDEMDKLREQAENIAADLSPYLEELWNILGGSMGETGGSISGLQAGIQGITESQAEILTAYANSCRFFLSSINTTLSDFATKVFDTEENSNPMLAHLRTIAEQTSAMRALLDSVTQSGHPKGQSGIRVFID